jgi:hypothetical protein
MLNHVNFVDSVSVWVVKSIRSMMCQRVILAVSLTVTIVLLVLCQVTVETVTMR